MSGRTLNPITIARDATASEMSFSVMAPAALCTMFTRTSSCGSFSSASDSAPERALDVGLQDQVELGDLRALLLAEQIRQAWADAW